MKITNFRGELTEISATKKNTGRDAGKGCLIVWYTTVCKNVFRGSKYLRKIVFSGYIWEHWHCSQRAGVFNTRCGSSEAVAIRAIIGTRNESGGISKSRGRRVVSEDGSVGHSHWASGSVHGCSGCAVPSHAAWLVPSSAAGVWDVVDHKRFSFQNEITCAWDTLILLIIILIKEIAVLRGNWAKILAGVIGRRGCCHTSHQRHLHRELCH